MTLTRYAIQYETKRDFSTSPHSKQKKRYIYCSEVEGSHDKESSINTPEGGFIHNMLCRSDGEVVAVLRCSPPCDPVLGGSSVLQAGQDPSQAGFWKESKRPHVNSPAHRSYVSPSFRVSHGLSSRG